MDLSIVLAKVMGLYFVIVSISFLLNKNRMHTIVLDLMQWEALQFLMGSIILILGSLLVVIHNKWMLSWQLMITIVGWLIFIKGILNIVLPDYVKRMTKPFMESFILPYISILLNLFIGLYLCYFGFLAS